METTLLKKMNKTIELNGYSTKTEFIREAIRKKLEEDEKELLMKEFLKYRGKAKKKTTYKENRKTRELVWQEYAKERGWSP